MCTVTFIAVAGKVFITSNRDESPSRQARGLASRHTVDGRAVHFPIDELSGGSWIALSDSGRAVCLLNGAFEPFHPAPPYRQSRGQVVMDATDAEDLPAFLSEYELDGIAPFTLLVYEAGRLDELVWDGASRHLQSLPTDTPRIWSSVTLYPGPVRAWRKSLFDSWLQNHSTIDRDAIMAFHHWSGDDPENDFVMNRDGRVKTLSVTSIVLQPGSGSILHLDLDREWREEILVQYAS